MWNWVVLTPFLLVFSRSTFSCSTSPVCGMISISTSQQNTGFLLHLILQSGSNSVRLCEDQAWTALFKSSHKFSGRFRSGLHLSHSKMFPLFSLNRFLFSPNAGNCPFLTTFDCSSRFSHILRHSLTFYCFPSHLHRCLGGPLASEAFVKWGEHTGHGDQYLP